MRAALLEEVNKPLVIADDVEIAEPGAGQVRVRVTHCGICHSDLSCIDGSFPTPMPVVLGHEAAGVVDCTGPGVTGLSPGDPVVLTPCPPCGRCYWCIRGEANLCVDASAIMTSTFADGSTGLSRRGETVYRGLGVGAFASHVITQAAGAVRIPAEVPLEVACVIGCAVQTGVGAVLNTAKVEAGATVLVMGLGGVGLSIVQGARIAGASRVIVSDPVAERRERARNLGATDLLDPGVDDVIERTRALTGVGADYAFEAVGRASLIEAGIAATRSGGTTVMVGAIPLDQPVTLSPAAAFCVTEKKLTGCVLGSSNSLYDIPRLIELWRTGRLDLEYLITARRPIAEINEAMDDLRASRGVRTVLSF